MLTAVIQALIGSPGAVGTLIAAGAGALLTVFVFPLGELGLRWLQAPMRLLTADVIAIREHVEQLQALAAVAPSKPKGISLRLGLLNHKRVGEELWAEYENKTKCLPEAVAQGWTNDVLKTLGEHAPESYGERFIAAGSELVKSGGGRGTTAGRMPQRLAELASLIAELGSKS